MAGRVPGLTAIKLRKIILKYYVLIRLNYVVIARSDEAIQKEALRTPGCFVPRKDAQFTMVASGVGRAKERYAPCTTTDGLKSFKELPLLCTTYPQATFLIRGDLLHFISVPDNQMKPNPEFRRPLSRHPDILAPANSAPHIKI